MALAFPSGRKPKSQRAKRVLLGMQSKLHEEERTAIFLRGTTANEEITSVLRDLHLMKKPAGQFFERKIDKRPFEDDSSVEFLCVKNDASLFAFGSHTKKRPLNLIMGRMYDAHIMDMFELGITNYKAMHNFKGGSFSVGCKPCMVFQGDGFENDVELVQLKSFFIDFFSSQPVPCVNLAGLEHVIICTATDAKTVLFRHYRILFKRSGLQTPRVALEELGPHLDLTLRRSRLAADDLRREAMKVPKGAVLGKEKNIEKSILGDRMGRVHVEKQNVEGMQLRKVKALKRKYNVENSDDEEGGEEDGAEGGEGINGHRPDVEEPRAGKRATRA